MFKSHLKKTIRKAQAGIAFIIFAAILSQVLNITQFIYTRKRIRQQSIERTYHYMERTQRVAKLETLTRQAKDYDFKDKAARRLDPKKVKLAADAFADLKESKNEAVVQEAKNCIADLTWALAELEGGKGLKKR